MTEDIQYIVTYELQVELTEDNWITGYSCYSEYSAKSVKDDLKEQFPLAKIRICKREVTVTILE